MSGSSNLSKPEEKLNFFKKLFKPKSQTAATFQKTHTKEFIFTPEILKDIGPESPANNRIKTIRELSDIVRSKRLEENAIEALWNKIKDLLQPQVPTENRQIALTFLLAVIEGQLPCLGILKGHFFEEIKKLKHPEDLSCRLDLFKALSENGKNLENFEEEAGIFVLSWMPDVMAVGKILEFFPLLVNLIKFNAAYLDEEIMSGIVQQVCMVPNRPRTEEDEDIKLCLDVIDVVVCYSYLPSDCLHHCVAALCRIVNMPKYCETSWELMRKLLGTHLGHSAVYTMACMLQDRQQPIDYKLLRGAVFYIGMALWGSKKVTTLKHTSDSVLPSFLQALAHGSPIVMYEVILSVQRLVKKYGKDLQYVTWDVILDILERLIKLIEKAPPEDRRIEVEIHDVLTNIENLHEHGSFNGSMVRFFSLIEMCASKRQEASVMLLISHQAQLIHPGRENWTEGLHQLLKKYYQNDSRTEIRKKCLNILSFNLSVHRHVFEDDLIEIVVLPHLNHIENDPDPVVRNVAVEVLLGILQNCNTHFFTDILTILEKIISKPLISKVLSPVEGQEVLILKTDESTLIDIKTSVLGVVDLFRYKLFTTPSSQCQDVYELLTRHVKGHFKHNYMSKTACSIRNSVINCLLKLRSDSHYRIGFTDRSHDGKLTFSPYVVCKPITRKERSASAPSSPTVDLTTNLWTQNPATIDYTDAFSIFIQCLEQEYDWVVLKNVLEQLPLLLQNKTLILSMDRDLIDCLCHRICAMINDRTLGRPEKFQNAPMKFTRSDFHVYVFPVLNSMVSYHSFLDRNRQRELIKCLEFGLVSKCAKTCVNSLRLCTLEMKDTMMRLLPSVLLQLSKISATMSMAIPVVAFLSSIVRLPKMYANFVEDEYMSVFAIALPYTNPFKFSHYTVSLAHHVIAIWFIRCRLPFRKGFVKFIQKGLKANVLQQFEENSQLNQKNEDSVNRQRSTSFTEGAMKSRRNMSGSGIFKPNFSSTADEKMSLFHKELTETCTDVMARYSFGNFTAIPSRSPVADFLLHGGQSQSWMLGNKLVTITTSGGAPKVGSTGLCETCLSAYQSSHEAEKNKQSSAKGTRKRHRSAAVTYSRSSSVIQMKTPEFQDDIVLNKSSYDDLNMSKDSCPVGVDHVGVQTGTSLTDHTSPQALESLLKSLKSNVDDQQHFTPNLCSCWCDGWAEVYLRSPSGDSAWMMRIQNEASIFSSQFNSTLPDISLLFAPVRKKQHSESDSSGKIDSGSLAEDEYETLHAKHFSSDSETKSSTNGMKKTGNQGTDSSTSEDSPRLERSNKSDVSSPGILRKSKSIPSINTYAADSDFVADFIQEKNNSKLIQQNEMNVGSELDTNNKDGVCTDLKVDVKEDEVMDMSTSKDEQPGSGLHCVSDSSDNEHSVQTIEEKNNQSMSQMLNVPTSMSERLTPSPVDSDGSTSTFEDIADLPIRKSRGHTISVMSPVHDSALKRELSFPLKAPANKEAVKGGISPNFVFLQLYHSTLQHYCSEHPVHLPQTEVTNRAMKMLDRMHPYETHKVGVIYVGPGQAQSEVEILSNQFGSERYAKFIQELGQLVRLQDCDQRLLFLGGLDVTGKDGKFAYHWQDESMQVIFHVATLMPNRESDPNCNAKKLHIGNDFVKIVYNDSGEDYKIGTIKCQFNYVGIIIRPLDHESNAVTLQTKEDIAEILGHTDTKIISDANLPTLVRHIAVHCNLASLVLQRQQVQPSDPFASNWLERLRQIKRIRAKILKEMESSDQVSDVKSSPKLNEDFTDYL